MGRVIFQGLEQTYFLKEVKSLSRLNSDQLGLLCGVSGRTVRDWSRGKFTISDKALSLFIRRFNLKPPQNLQIVNDFWYISKGSKKGGLRRFELYGPPGTSEGRKKGGSISQLKRRENPEKYRLLGCNIKKEFQIKKTSVELAEVAGIVLGDGAITNNHLRVTVSSIVDEPYADYITRLFYKIFKEKPKLFKRKSSNALDLTINGVGIVEELENWGFVRGNKVRHQVDFPNWIWRNSEYQIACIRGLMDTDGGCYFHKHKSNGLVYINFGMSFANQSLPLVMGMAKVLTALGIKFSLAKENTRIYIYSFEEVKKYFSLIGSNNAKNNEKFNYYLNQKTHRVLDEEKFTFVH